MTLGQQIKKKRLQQRISLRNLATQIKVSPGTLSRIERNITETEIRDTTKEQIKHWLKGEDTYLPNPTSKTNYNLKSFARELAESFGWKIAS